VTLFAACFVPAEAVAAGAVTWNVRMRHEAVAQTSLRGAEALTARVRLGFAPAPWEGWSALVEVESIAAVDGDRYSQAGLNPAAAGRAVIGDPDSTEINQLHFGRTFGKTLVRLGRQRLFLDQGRFVGDGSWRQNQQTFDAAVIEDRTWAGTTLTYAHLRQVNRGLGRTHPQGRWRMDSHLFHALREGLPLGTLNTYAYFLDFPEMRANACATLGASLAGGAAMSPGMRWVYRVEAARQTDHGASPLDYAARYLAAESGVNLARGGPWRAWRCWGTTRVRPSARRWRRCTRSTGGLTSSARSPRVACGTAICVCRRIYPAPSRSRCGGTGSSPTAVARGSARSGT
jgi:hypothetical protein